MITVKNWVPSIPTEDKRLAYVGENAADYRYFLIADEDAAKYQNWGFHLDVAFDLSTVTTVSTHSQQTVQETEKETLNENLSETKNDAVSSHTATTTKENRDVTNVTVACDYPTDVVSLSSGMTNQGLLLTWKILRQHTMLPGKLKATIRAVSSSGQVKKSAMMVFYVEAAVAAEPAAAVPLSEFEQMEQRMDPLASRVENAATVAEAAAQQAESQREVAEQAALEAGDAAQQAQTAAEKAQTKVESLYERNQNKAVSLWMGTMAEYEAITQKENNRLYLITDDPDSLAGLSDRLTTLEGRCVIAEGGTGRGSDWAYRQWSDGRLECWTRDSCMGNTTITSAWGSIYKSNSKNFGGMNYPIPFVDSGNLIYGPSVVATLEAPGGYNPFLIPFNIGSNSKAPSYQLANPLPLTVSNIHCHIYVTGHWKLPKEV